jgi:hypothetical protein
MTPFEQAFLFLKEMTEEDYEFASRTGGLPGTPERRFRNIHGQMEQAAANTAGGLQGGQDAPLTAGQASALDEAHFGPLGKPQPEGRGDTPAPDHPDIMSGNEAAAWAMGAYGAYRGAGGYTDRGNKPRDAATREEGIEWDPPARNWEDETMDARRISDAQPPMRGPPSTGEMSALYDAPWTEGMKWPMPSAPEQEPQPEPATEQPQTTGPMSPRDERIDTKLQEILGRSTSRAAEQHITDEAQREARRAARRTQRGAGRNVGVR